MTSKSRLVSVAAALSMALAASAGAQELATYGAVEAAGFGEGSAILGMTLSSGQHGLTPFIAGNVQTYRFQDGINSHTNAFAFSPSAGLQYRMTDGAVQAGVGYTFVSSEVTGPLIVGDAGGRNGVFATVQGNYWGGGENTAQYIGAYNFASEYYWTRGRAAHRVAPAMYLGGEVVLQGSQDFTPSVMRYEVGPTIEYRISPEFRLGASGGFRGGNNNAAGSGYLRLEFLLLSRL